MTVVEQAVPPEAARVAPPGEAAALPLEQTAREAVASARTGMPRALARFAALSDPTRLELLVAIHAAPGAPVKVLAAATGLTPNTTTQALAALRACGLVERVRDGRLSRWHLADDTAHELLHQLGAGHSPLHPEH
ncbi:ArsR/SmtB family transcription factor [Quadrisphaera granulorum]|uniref:ArsR/SmtB family transcription factor n=1 Tax=Quadrisphaera granulorum TaxID=317664 RepID=UPI001B85D212|nr:metalloregulator ArsR/SmtB family transcription factor [Quadrisphaera granulorum]